MGLEKEWAKAFARQADADFKAWELYERFPDALSSTCHKALFLQMACEKICKAWLIESGSDPAALQGSHAYIAKNLHQFIKSYMALTKVPSPKLKSALKSIKQLAEEIEVLNPAVDRDGQRPDNCEYPWQIGSNIFSPLDYKFTAIQLLKARSGKTFLKYLRLAIGRLL